MKQPTLSRKVIDNEIRILVSNLFDISNIIGKVDSDIWRWQEIRAYDNKSSQIHELCFEGSMILINLYSCKHVIDVCSYCHSQLMIFVVPVFNLHNIFRTYEVQFHQAQMKIICFFTWDQIWHLTHTCNKMNHEDKLLIISIMKWMSQFQISQKNILIVGMKVTIGGIVYIENNMSKSVTFFSLLNSFFFYIT